MVPSLPTSTQWITFPVEPRDTVRVEWTESKGQERDAIYYACKCFWGFLADKEKAADHGKLTGPRKAKALINEKVNIRGDSMWSRVKEIQYRRG